MFANALLPLRYIVGFVRVALLLLVTILHISLVDIAVKVFVRNSTRFYFLFANVEVLVPNSTFA